jgi:uncharacterized repeat protein (TIGR01451 family)
MIAGQAVVPALVQPASAALSTNFFDYQNHDVATSGAGLVDWANNGALTTSNVVGSTWSRAGSQGLFNGGVYNGGTKPPTAPGLTAAGLALKAAGTMESSTFVADPISSDNNFSCQGPSGPVTVSGDPTTFAGAGSETNNGQLSTFTYGSSGNTPPKDDLSNVYAISHNTATAHEIFFGGERIVNNGASHIDFEFLQATLTVPNPCAAGTMTGHRTQRDLLLSTDFTNGGALSGSQLYSWSCNGKAPGAPGYDASKDFTVCDPGANGNPGNGDPQYVAVTDPASSFGVNTGVNGITCGGWVCRDGSGTGTSTLLTNAFMEGGIDLAAAGFNGCINTFLPHTRSSPSFTAVLKDFAGPIAFSNCKTPTVTTQQSSAGVTSGANITIGLGASVTDAATLHGPAAHVGGTVAYKLFSDANCTTQVGSTSTKTIDGSPDGNGDLVLPTSDAITPPTAGTYYWTAAYSGDTATGGQNNSATSACGAEVLTVSPPVIHVTKTADASSVSSGTAIGFTVTVSNSGLGTATGVTLTDALPGGNAATPVHWTIDATTGDPASFAISGADGSQHLTLAGQPITLASGASLTVHMTAATSSTSCTTYNNTASVTTTNGGSDEKLASEIVNCPHIAVSKTADHQVPVSAGTPIGFTVTVSNPGPGNATGVTLTDSLPGGNALTPVHWTIDGSTGDPASFAITGADGAQHLTLAGQPISLASLASLTVHVTAATSSTSCTKYDNTALATTSNDGSGSDNASETVNCPHLAVVKTADHQAPVSAGSAIGFTVTVSNSGLGTAAGATLTDPLPGGDGVSWSISPAYAGSGTCSIAGSAPSQTLNCTFGDMAPTASNSVHVTSATTAASCKAYVNSVTVVATNNASVESLPATETVNCPDVAVAKTADHEGHVSAGTSIGFRVTVSNSGLGDATGVTLTDALPGGNAGTPVHWTIDGTTGDPASFVIAGADGSQQLTLAGQPISLTADSSLTVHVTATTSSTSCTTYDNTATVAATNNPTTIKPAPASETVDCPSLTITKTADVLTVNTGDPIGFTIVVSNSGPGTATAVVLNDPLPAGNGVDWSISPADPACSITGTAPNQVLVCSFGDLAADDSVTVHIASATTAASGGRYDNTATASAHNHGPVDASAFIVVQPPVLSITKAADAAQVTAGSAIGFTIKVANGDAEGTGIARAATLSDPLPGRSGVSWSIDPAYAGPGTCSITGAAPHQTLNCAFGDMAPGAKASVHVTSATTAASVGDYPNTATVSATNGTPVDASATTSVIADTPVSIQGSIPTTTTTTTIAPAPLPLPFTGSSAAALAAIALVLMATGGTMILSRRRRRALQ